MKLQIKTLNQKSLLIDIDDTKTVYDVKKELALYPDVGVEPELQKLIYAGRVLSNDDQLSSYNIDVKKFLVVMTLKQPEEEGPVTSQIGSSNIEEKKTEDTSKTTAPVSVCDNKDIDNAFKAPQTPVASQSKSKNDELVSNIVSMGYPEEEVRRALAASFNNPERAIEYLIEGIPTSPSAPEGAGYSDTDADLTMSPFEIFRSDPLFRNLRRAIQQHPELIDSAIQRVGEANPTLLSLINENQQEFLSMLIEPSDEEDDDD